MQGGVLECAAVGVPDAHSGEAVKLFAVKKAPNLTEQDLRRYHARPTRRLQSAEDTSNSAPNCRRPMSARSCAARCGTMHDTPTQTRQPPMSSRSGARPDPNAGSRRTPSSTTTFAGASSRLHEAAAAGKLTGWEASAEGALALLILLDQFPRNMFRGAGAHLRDRSTGARHCQPRYSQWLRWRVSRPAQFFLFAVRTFRGSGRPGARPDALQGGRRRRRA